MCRCIVMRHFISKLSQPNPASSSNVSAHLLVNWLTRYIDLVAGKQMCAGVLEETPEICRSQTGVQDPHFVPFDKNQRIIGLFR